MSLGDITKYFPKLYDFLHEPIFQVPSQDRGNRAIFARTSSARMNSVQTETWLLPPRGAAALTPDCVRAPAAPTPAPGTRAANDQ